VQSVLTSLPKILMLPIIIHGLYDGVLLWSGFEIKQTENYWFSLVDILALSIVVLAFVIGLFKV
jgi:hypothetical protein